MDTTDSASNHADDIDYCRTCKKQMEHDGVICDICEIFQYYICEILTQKKIAKVEDLVAATLVNVANTS